MIVGIEPSVEAQVLASGNAIINTVFNVKVVHGEGAEHDDGESTLLKQVMTKLTPGPAQRARLAFAGLATLRIIAIRIVRGASRLLQSTPPTHSDQGNSVLVPQISIDGLSIPRVRLVVTQSGSRTDSVLMGVMVSRFAVFATVLITKT